MKNIDFSKYYDEALFAGIVISIAIGIWFLYRSLIKPGDERTIEINEDNLSLTETQAQLIADNLWGAMKRLGTDENAIYEAFEKIQTPDDAILVSEKFGVRKYGQGGHVEFLGYDLNLKSWLAAELTTNDMKPIKDKYEWL